MAKNPRVPWFSTVAESPDISYLINVNPVQISQVPRLSAETIALAQSAFREFYASCFWFMRSDAVIVAEEVPYLCERLRADGGRRGFLLAAELCR